MSREILPGPALAEKYAGERGIIDGNVARLRRHLSAAQNDNLFVRGSFVRGDAPYGDIDISAYNIRGGYRTEVLPEQFEQIPISYGFIPLEHLEEYFETCLRGSSSLMETVELTVHDSTPSTIIQDQQKKFLTERTADYLLFLSLEETVSRQKYEGIENATYQDMKRKRGSKRTISRMIWAYKALYPQLYAVPGTQGVMRELVDAGVVPTSLNESVGKVLTLLKNPGSGLSEWNDARARVGDWFDGEVQPLILKEAKALPNPLRTIADVATDPTSSRIDLITAADFGLEVFTGYRQWMVLFALAGNSRLDSKSLVDIFSFIKGKYIYRNVIRNLIYNPAFPIEELVPSDIAEDTYAQLAYRKRLHKKS